MIDDIVTIVGLSLKSFVSGAFGGLVSLKFFEGLSWAGRVWTVAGGALIAGYSTQWVIGFLELSEKHEHFMGFVLGLFGMSAVSALIKAITSADLWEEIKARLPGRKG